MSGGLFDQPLYETPGKARAKRGGAGKRSERVEAPADIKAAVRQDVSAEAKSADVSRVAAAADHAAVPINSGQSKDLAQTAGPGPVRSVSEINGLIGRVLQAQLPAVLRVRGEISNFNVYSKGHAFSNLKISGPSCLA